MKKQSSNGSSKNADTTSVSGPISSVSESSAISAVDSSFPNSKKIYVLRTEAGAQRKIAFNYKEALKGELNQNVALQAGDTIVVP